MWEPPDDRLLAILASNKAKHPILMNQWSVRRILDEAKTNTRQVINPQPQQGMLGDWSYFKSTRTLYATQTWMSLAGMQKGLVKHCPYGAAGDLLWVRETWATPGNYDHIKPSDLPKSTSTDIIYRAGNQHGDAYYKWRPSIHMPRWAARIWLQVEEVRVERVQDICCQDAIAEGVEFYQRSYGVSYKDYSNDKEAYFLDARTSFFSLWDSIYRTRGLGWRQNPFVWAIVFKVAHIAGRTQ